MNPSFPRKASFVATTCDYPLPAMKEDVVAFSDPHPYVPYGTKEHVYYDLLRRKDQLADQMLQSFKPAAPPAPNPGGTSSMSQTKGKKKKHVVTVSDFEYGSAEYYEFLAKRQRKAEKKLRKAEKIRKAEEVERERVREAKVAEADDRLRTAMKALEQVATKGKDDAARVAAAELLIEERNAHASTGY